MTTIVELMEQMEREARAAGLPGDLPKGRGVRVRRRQVSVVALLVFFGLCVVTLRAVPVPGDRLVVSDLLRAAMITVAGAFVAYAWQQERHLRRLDDLDGTLRQVDLAVADRLLHNAVLAAAEGSLHDSLVLEHVLERTLEQATTLVDARYAVVRLVGADGRLRSAASSAGAPVSGHTALAARAALARLTIRQGHVAAAPLVLGERLLGVLVVVADDGTVLDEDDAVVVGDLATRAALAIHNSRLYEDALVALDDHRPPSFA